MEVIRTDAGRRVVLPVSFADQGERIYLSEVNVMVQADDGAIVVPRHEFSPTGGTYILSLKQLTTPPNEGGIEVPDTPVDPEPEPDPGGGETELPAEPEPPIVEPDPVEGMTMQMATFLSLPEPPTFYFPTVDPYDPQSTPESMLLILESDVTARRSIEEGVPEGLIVTIDGITDKGRSFSLDFIVSIRANKLIPWVSSCDNYIKMMLAVADLPLGKSADFLAMPRADRETALVDAFDAVLSLPLRVRSESKHKGKPFIALSDEDRLAAAALDKRFVRAMVQAQAMEACARVNEDPVAQARSNGLISMTVGESSQFYGSGKTLASTMRVMSKDAAQLLSPWLDFSVKLGRA